MQFLRSVLGGGGGFNLPYVIGDPYSTTWGSWTHYKGTAKEDNSPVSIFAITGSNAQDTRITAARNGVKRLRTLRHPNVLSFLYSGETETVEGGVTKPVVYLVTEPVIPLADKLKELNLSGTQRDEYYAWGLHAISKAVSFLNNDCKLVHGNVCVAAVVVTSTLDWKLHAFDVLSEFDGGNPSADGPMLAFEWMVGTQYKPMEVAKSDWATVRKSPPWAIDAWGLGCLIHELFSAAMLSRTEDLRSTQSIPKTLLPDYQKLLSSAPGRRMNPSKLVDNSEFFQNKLVETIQFMEVLNLKDSMEKDNFFRKMQALSEQLPRQIVLKKLLPLLASALEFGSASAAGLSPLLKIGAWLPTDEFNAKILPTIVKLFASTDRAIRIGLLQNIDTFSTSLSPTVVDEQIFPHVSTGFADTSAFLRELTLKSMLTLVPRLSQRTLSAALLKHLSKLQVDEEPAIRTNTTILLGNIARHLNDSTRKRVLVNAFTVRALRDAFPPARSAGILALMATVQYYDVAEMATRILPHLVTLTVDPDSDVREKAFKGTDTFLKAVKDYYKKLEAGELTSSGTTVAEPAPAGPSSLLGWAVSSLTSKGGKGAESASISQGTTTSTTTTTGSAVPGPSLSAPSALGQSGGKAQPGVAPPESHGEPPMPSSMAAPIVNDGWGDIDGGNGTTTNEDADGWDDMDMPEEAPPPSLARIQAAQQKPVAMGRPRSQSLSSSSLGLSAAPPSTSSTNGSDSTRGARASEKQPSLSSAGDGWNEDGDDDDPWADIAAPVPKTVVRPLAATAATAAPSGVRRASAGQAAQHVSLESILGNKMSEGGGGRGVGRGRAKPAAPKLGAQRIVK